MMWFIVFLGFLNLYNCDDLTVKIEQGVLQGKYWQSFHGRQFIGFTGIPFAKPPVGELRFKEAETPEPWDGIFDATKSHNICPQYNIYDKLSFVGNEDCLYLNVYTPTIQQSETGLLPVMFYIHGGAFLMGSAIPEWIGPEYILDRDIVLVAANYRLATLGFLSTLDDVVPGNNGIKDQTFALRWVQKNIKQFGGDPDRVTIFGNSAGACSVHLHVLSPLSKGLFHRAIIQSGNSLPCFISDSRERARENAKLMGSLLNCPDEPSSEELVTCLRQASVAEILKHDCSVLNWDGEIKLLFLPMVETTEKGAFLSKTPIEYIKSGEISDVPIMIGLVEQEAAYKAAYLHEDPRLIKILDENFHTIIPDIFEIRTDVYNAVKKVRKYYFGDEDITNNTKHELASMYTDRDYVLLHNITMTLHSKLRGKPIYQYYYDYRGSESYATLFGDKEFNYGVSHVDELLSLIKMKVTFPDYTPNDLDIKMINVLTTMWANFAETGNPTPDGRAPTGVLWKPAGENGLKYYHIKSYNDFRMKDGGIHPERADFWRKLQIIKF